MSYAQLHSAIINPEADDELQCSGYKHDAVKSFFFYVTSVLSLGTLNLVTYWKPAWKVKLTKSLCSLQQCDTVILRDDCSDVFVEKIQCIGSEDASSTYILNCTGFKKRYFEHRCIRFLWDDAESSFVPLSGIQPKCMELLENYHGVTDSEHLIRKAKYGPNVIEVDVKSYWTLLITEVLNPFYVFQLLSITLWCTDEYYYYAGCIFFISCVSIGVSLYETKQQSQTLHDMIAAQLVPAVTVWRKGKECMEVASSELVPGDLIVIPEHGAMMCCDAVLITGNCIVNESMLTGESVPVTKTPLTAQDESEVYCPDAHRRHTLFSGTEVVQTRYYGNSKVLAVVVRTGFITSKGELIRSIMFPKPIGFTFYRDAIRFIIILFIMACGGMAYSIYIYVERNASIKEILLRGLDIFTIVVPPSLPAAMTVGMVYAQGRMKRKGIFCISPPRINIAGKIKVVCFDKTGTLTEDGLDLHGVIPTDDNKFSAILHDPTVLPTHNTLIAAMATCHSLTLINGNLTGDPLDIKMFEATKWEIEEQGEDSSKFDQLMPTVVRPPIAFSYQHSTLNMSGCNEILTEPGKDLTKFDTLMPSIVKPVKDMFNVSDSKDQMPYEIGIVRQFTFSSNLQRMSVIVRCLGAEHMDVYVKGAPEKIASLCIPSSLPADFSDVLHQYSILGFRVLALAFKPFPSKVTWHQAQRLKRDFVESDLTFLGLLLMQNALKPETKPVIKLLHEAELKTIMVTGDNMLTAVSVARECLMIPTSDHVMYLKGLPANNQRSSAIEWDFEQNKASRVETEIHSTDEMTHQLLQIEETQDFHIAVDGKSFAVIRSDFPEDYQKLLVKGKVFARMAPDQKTQLIEDLQELSYIVGMCGDGANDCGALKAAHIGISLSEAEASVAAPFTSKIPNIQCVPEVIKEGRCALVTSFGVFKYMALYSMIQFISVLILYTEGSVLGDMMFLYIDLCITTTVAVLMGLTGPYKKIVARRPQGSLVSFVTISSVVTQIILCLAFQLFSLHFLQSQKWYVKTIVTSKDQVMTWEGTVIFCMSCYQYIILATVFSKGPPYRQPLYRNVYFFISLIVLTSFSTLLMFDPVSGITHFFQLKGNSHEHLYFKIYLLCIAATNFTASAIVEIVISSNTFKKASSVIKRKRLPKNLYKRLEMEMDHHATWLSADSTGYSPTIS